MRKYQPSNGSEGDMFISKFCMKCIHNDPHIDGFKNCNILSETMMYHVTDDEYPSEWTFDDRGKPTCTQWREWDWDEKGNPDDPSNPNYVQPEDPNQLKLFQVVLVLIMSLMSAITSAQCPGDTWDDAPIIVLGGDAFVTENICNGTPFGVGTPPFATTCAYLCGDENFWPTCVDSDHDFFRKVTLLQDAQFCVIVESTGEYGYVMSGPLFSGAYGGFQVMIYDMSYNIIFDTCSGAFANLQYIFIDLGWMPAGDYMIRIDGDTGTCGCVDLTAKTITFLDLSIEEKQKNQPSFGPVYDVLGRLIRN